MLSPPNPYLPTERVVAVIACLLHGGIRELCMRALHRLLHGPVYQVSTEEIDAQ